jgi:hypothetical protein
MLRRFAEAVHEAHENIEVVDDWNSLEVAIPEGERTLSQVLQPDTCRRISEQLNVTYLILVSPLYEHEGEIEGPLMVGIGAWGVAKQELEARFGATIFKLESGKPLCNVTAEADATMVVAGWFFPFVVGPWAEGDLNTIRGVANEVGKAINEDAKAENVRVVVTAATSDQQALEDEALMARAKQGDAEAQYKIHWGLVRPDNLRWLCLAADQEHRAAQGRLGDIYYNGWFGVDSDFVRSYMWFTLATRGQGEWADWAKRQLELRLKFKELTPDDVRRAEKMAAEWEPGQCVRDLALTDAEGVIR